MPVAFFDLDNTLIDRAGAFERSAALLARDLALDPQEVVPFLVEADCDGDAGRMVWCAAARERFGLMATVDELAVLQKRHFLASLRPDPLIQRALTELRAAGWKVAVVSNGPPTQPHTIAACGLEPLVDAVAVSGPDGARKPDARLFALAAARCNGAIEGSWVVGDRADADIEGAHRIGARSIWIDRGFAWPASVAPPDHVVRNVPDAVRIILGVG